MLRPCQEPLLACSLLPTAGVPVIDGAAVLVGGLWPGGVFEIAEVTERVTSMRRVTKDATATFGRVMPSPSCVATCHVTLKGVFRFCADLPKLLAKVPRPAIFREPLSRDAGPRPLGLTHGPRVPIGPGRRVCGTDLTRAGSCLPGRTG
jgi:hypothetical protein